jgi:hypothetical protein
MSGYLLPRTINITIGYRYAGTILPPFEVSVGVMLWSGLTPDLLQEKNDGDIIANTTISSAFFI